MNEKTASKPTLHPRKLARQIAKASLDHEGVTGYNKQRIVGGKRFPSLFSVNWRELCINSRVTAPRKKKGVRK
jgi:hypothetical protein